MSNSTTSFKTDEPPRRRTDDEMRLKVLEVQSQYEIKYLSESFQDLRAYVKDSLRREADRFNALDKKVTVIIFAIIAQMAGLDLSLLIKAFV